MGLQRFPIGDFRGGWNTRDAPQELEANEAQDVLNVTLAPLVGALQQRLGKTRFDTASFPGGVRADNLKAWYPAVGTSLLIASINGTIYTITTGGVCTSRFVGTAGTVWAFEPMQDAAGTMWMWAMNGTDAPQKINAAGACTAWAGTPPNGTMLKVFRNRMAISGVAATRRRIFFSNIGDPETPITSYGTQWTDIMSTGDDMDPVTELQGFVNDLYAFKGNSTWKVTNGSPPWDNVKVVDDGCYGRFQSAVIQQKLYFFNRRGIFSVDVNGSLDEESSSISPLWIGDAPRMAFGALDKVRVLATPAGRLLAAIPLDASTTNNFMIELIPNMNFRRLGGRHYVSLPAVLLHSYTVASMVVFRPGSQDIVIAGASDIAGMHWLFHGATDDGVAISAYWLTGWKSLIAEEPFERLRRVNVELKGTLTIDVLGDFSNITKFTKRLAVSLPPDSLWDGGVWDGGTWDPASDTQLVRFRPETRARYHAFRFRNAEISTSFIIYAAEVALRGGKEH